MNWMAHEAPQGATVLAYQHAYHAGNIADVHKHLTLFALGLQLIGKKSAITWVDTHAGRGVYPISANETQRGGEYREGVLPLWESRGRFSQDNLVHQWLDALALLNPTGSLDYYPGSPWWFTHLMRQGDRLELYELHPGEHAHLEACDTQLARGARRHFCDGIEGLVTHLPVSTPRLCVLMDPSYEIKSDYSLIADTLARVANKVRHAVVAIWYPLLPEGRHSALLDGIRDHGVRKVLRSELIYGDPSKGRGMYGSGMLVYNPPWQLDIALGNSIEQLAALYQGHSTMKWWVPE